jgi:hypothetical protein
MPYWLGALLAQFQNIQARRRSRAGPAPGRAAAPG